MKLSTRLTTFVVVSFSHVLGSGKTAKKSRCTLMYLFCFGMACVSGFVDGVRRRRKRGKLQTCLYRVKFLSFYCKLIKVCYPIQRCRCCMKDISSDRRSSLKSWKKIVPEWKNRHCCIPLFKRHLLSCIFFHVLSVFHLFFFFYQWCSQKHIDKLFQDKWNFSEALCFRLHPCIP